METLTKEEEMPNLLISAGPGCGKTHTLVDSYLYYQTPTPLMWRQRFPCTDEQFAIYEWIRKTMPKGIKTVPYIAYNNTIVKELEKKIHEDCEVHTHHGWGYSVIRKKFGHVPMNPKRSEILVAKITGQDMSQLKNKFEWLTTIKFIEKLKDELLEVKMENFYLLQSKYSDLAPFRIHQNICQQASQLITAMKQVDRSIGIEFIDQIWLALFILDKPWFEFGFVDECQDQSPARLLLAQKLCKHLICAGDENQAINAWTGADPYAIDKIRASSDLELPLKLSFRLPPNRVERANQIKPLANLKGQSTTPGIEASVDGENLQEWIKDTVQYNPLIVCRYNAPLVRLGIHCIKLNIPAKVLGSSLYDALVRTLENRQARDIPDALHKLDLFEKRCLEVGDDMAKEGTIDKINACRFILGRCTVLSDFKVIAKRLTNPPKSETKITGLTVHRAKGLEANVVGVLNPPIASSKAKTSTQKLQEENCMFVGETRTRRDHYYLSF